MGDRKIIRLAYVFYLLDMIEQEIPKPTETNISKYQSKLDVDKNSLLSAKQIARYFNGIGLLDIKDENLSKLGKIYGLTCQDFKAYEVQYTKNKVDEDNKYYNKASEYLGKYLGIQTPKQRGIEAFCGDWKGLSFEKNSKYEGAYSLLLQIYQNSNNELEGTLRLCTMMNLKNPIKILNLNVMVQQKITLAIWL